MTETPPDPPPLAPFPVKGTKRLYDSPWVSLRRDVLRLDNGAQQDHHVVEIPDAVVIVPVRADGAIVMVWQYRHTLGRTHWEVPAGRVNEGESPADAAARELREETGHRAATLKRLGDFYPLNGISDHHAHVFTARGCEEVGSPELDASERLVARAIPADVVRERLHRGEFEDGFTALALFHYFARREG